MMNADRELLLIVAGQLLNPSAAIDRERLQLLFGLVSAVHERDTLARRAAQKAGARS